MAARADAGRGSLVRFLFELDSEPPSGLFASHSAIVEDTAVFWSYSPQVTITNFLQYLSTHKPSTPSSPSVLGASRHAEQPTTGVLSDSEFQFLFEFIRSVCILHTLCPSPNIPLVCDPFSHPFSYFSLLIATSTLARVLRV